MLQVTNLHKSFSEKKILKGISFGVNKGEIVFILGTSGTGKSVLLKILVGLMSADDGQINIDGQSILGLSERSFFEIRRKVGMVFQQPALFDSLTVYENIVFGLRRDQLSEVEKKQRALDSLTSVKMKNILDKYPYEISYGMQKRVSLARTLAIKPQILLYDEPTTGLDPISTQAINSLIKELSHSLQTTSIVVSHDMQCALDIADKIIVLDKGCIVANGTPQQILESDQSLVQDFMAEVRR